MKQVNINYITYVRNVLKIQTPELKCQNVHTNMVHLNLNLKVTHVYW